MLRILSIVLLTTAIQASPTWLERTLSGDLEQLKKQIDSQPSLIQERNKDNQSPADIAAQKGHHKMLDWLLTTDPKLLTHRDKMKNTLLHHAVNSGSLETVQVVLNHDQQKFLLSFLQPSQKEQPVKSFIASVSEDLAWQWLEAKALEKGLLETLKRSDIYEKTVETIKKSIPQPSVPSL